MRRTTIEFMLLPLLLLACAALSNCALSGGASPTTAPTTLPRTAAAPASPASAAVLRDYSDPAGYLTIAYPPSWQVSAADRQVEFVEPSGQLHILVQYADAGQPLDEAMLRDLIDSYFAGGELEGVGSFKREAETVRDDGGIRLEYSFVSAGMPGYGSSLFLQQGTVIYILSFWVGRQELWAPNQALFDAVAGTFKPTPPSR